MRRKATLSIVLTIQDWGKTQMCRFFPWQHVQHAVRFEPPCFPFWGRDKRWTLPRHAGMSSNRLIWISNLKYMFNILTNN
jgi:hypothetical protein